MAASKGKTREDVSAEYAQILFHNEFRTRGFLLSKIRFLKVLMKAWRIDSSRLDTNPDNK